MSYTVSVSKIMTRVRQKANLEGAAFFISDPELVDMISVSYAEWYDMVRLTGFGGQYFRKPYPFNTVSQQSAYALPSDFLSLLSVDIFQTPNGVVSARPYQEEERNRYLGPMAGTYGTAPYRYQLQGSNINFIPTPQSGVPVTLNYTPTAATFSGSADSFDAVNGWEEWIVIDCAIKSLIKDGQLDTIPMLSNERERQAQRIREAAAEREQMDAEVVHDVARNCEVDWEWY